MQNSEHVFAGYLLENRFNVQYERRIGESDPDFRVWHEDGTPFAFWDVADREFTAKDQVEIDRLVVRIEAGLPIEAEGGPTKGYDFVRAKIRRKFLQFKKASPVPGMLVLAEWTGRAQVDPAMMAAALYGWPQITVPLKQLNPTPSLGRADDGKMIEQKMAEDNRYISAIGILQLRPINRYVHGLVQLGKDVLDRFDVSDHAFGLIDQEERRQRAKGIDLDLLSPVLDIYLVSEAHYPWPEEVRGNHDRVYAYDVGTSQYNLISDGLVAAALPHMKTD